MFIAGDRPTWKDANHKFRKMPEIAISGIPTMGLFDGKKVTRKLEGQEIAKKANRDMLFELWWNQRQTNILTQCLIYLNIIILDSDA